MVFHFDLSQRDFKGEALRRMGYGETLVEPRGKAFPLLFDIFELEKIMDIMLIFVFVIAAFLGLELIAKVPSQLHTPLMSGTNAISGITVVGAVSITAVAVKVGGKLGAVLGFLAIVFATINVIGGYMVTDRMLGMFKKKDDTKK